MLSPAQLLHAYRATSYEVRMPHGARATLRIGKAVPEILQCWANSAWPLVFLTGCNPSSKKLPLEENRNRMRAIVSRLDQYRVRRLVGVGRIPHHPWREPSLLVAGLSLEAADLLAIEFHQNAIVVAEKFGSARLRLYRNEWHGCIDNEDNITWTGA